LELRLPVAQLLLAERKPLLAFRQIRLGLLDQPAPCVEIGADLLVPARARVDLRRAPRDRLVQQALALGERLPGPLELVAVFRHCVIMTPRPDRKNPIFNSSTSIWEDSWSL
jgi:hypothetical protein